MINMRTKFEFSSSSRFRDILGGLKFKMGHGCCTIKRNLSKSAFSEGVVHFERKFWVDGDVARNPCMDR